MKHIKSLIGAIVFPLIGYRPQRVSAQAWDCEYQDGKWKYLGGMDSIAGLSSILGYCQFLKPAAILDAGCGEGLLAEKLKLLAYTSYLGIDVSAAAIAAATQRLGDDRTVFELADAQAFQTGRRFDAIIFNQSLYYLPDPDAIMRRYAALLAPQGRIIVSMYDSPRTRAAWPLVERVLRVEDAMMIQQGRGRVTTKVLLPR